MEEWKEIEGYEKLYEISNYGRVRVFRTRRVKKQVVNEKGYHRVSLTKNGKTSWKRVHRLVMKAFSEDYREDLQVNHKDFDKGNNHIDNLEMLSLEANLKHYFENGEVEQHIRKGIEHHNAKINDEIAKYIYDLSQLYSRNLVVEMVQEKYNVTISKWVVKDIKNKKTWKHIHEEIQ